MVCLHTGTAVLNGLTLLEPKSRFGDRPVKFQVVCPQNGTAVLKGLSENKELIADFSTLSHMECRRWVIDIYTWYMSTHPRLWIVDIL